LENEIGSNISFGQTLVQNRSSQSPWISVHETLCEVCYAGKKEFMRDARRTAVSA